MSKFPYSKSQSFLARAWEKLSVFCDGMEKEINSCLQVEAKREHTFLKNVEVWKYEKARCRCSEQSTTIWVFWGACDGQSFFPNLHSKTLSQRHSFHWTLPVSLSPIILGHSCSRFLQRDYEIYGIGRFIFVCLWLLSAWYSWWNSSFRISSTEDSSHRDWRQITKNDHRG